MKKFLIRTLLLSIPSICYVLLIFIVDPFNYHGLISNRHESTKNRIADMVEPHLFRLIAFDRDPQPNILLGDSRTNRLLVCKETQNFSNLTYYGSSLNEMISSFWVAVERIKLDTVIMGINLNQYNKYNKKFWIR